LFRYLPKTIKIDNITYTVKRVKNLKGTDCKKVKKLLGTVFFTQGLIKVEENTQIDAFTVALAHEISHAIIYERNIAHLIQSEHLETIVDCLAKAIIQIIRDNPGLIKFIRQDK